MPLLLLLSLVIVSCGEKQAPTAPSETGVVSTWVGVESSAESGSEDFHLAEMVIRVDGKLSLSLTVGGVPFTVQGKWRTEETTIFFSLGSDSDDEDDSDDELRGDFILAGDRLTIRWSNETTETWARKFGTS